MRSSISFWDILTGLSLMAGTALALLFTLIFTNPRTPLNPFPPPTQVSAVMIPTSTPTARMIPATWTPTPRPSATLAPEGTGLPTATPTATFFVLPSSTATLVPTWTPTATRTLLPSSTVVPTSTAFIVPTWTQVPAATNTSVPVNTNTPAPPTLTFTPIPPTLTSTAVTPGNPTGATETHGAQNNVWQNSVSTPSFTWTPPAGAIGYYVYFGSDPNGTTTTQQTVNSFTAPSAVQSGSINYLRVRTRTTGGDAADFSTLFTFKFDNVPPTNPTASAAGLTSGQWTNNPALNPPSFVLSGATDPIGGGVGSSGLASYSLYWGGSPTGSTMTNSVPHVGVGATFVPSSPIPSGATYYLRGKSKDAAGNEAVAWQDLFVFRFDNTPPSNPTSISANKGVVNNTWTTVNNEVTFTFNGASDGGSGIAGYYVYFGPSSSDTSSNLQTANTYVSGLSADGTYYLRVRAQDQAGNAASGWVNFIYRVDTTPPGAPPPPALEDVGATSGVATDISDPVFRWTAGTDAASGVTSYDVYWQAGTDCNPASAPTITNIGETRFQPPVLDNPATWYLCVRSRDGAGLLSAWEHMFTYIYQP